MLLVKNKSSNLTAVSCTNAPKRGARVSILDWCVYVAIKHNCNALSSTRSPEISLRRGRDPKTQSPVVLRWGVFLGPLVCRNVTSSTIFYCLL
ncbi:ORF R U10 [Macacine gammaherpesvirus 5]|uniref:ORFRU10-L n=1 Tax=Rhesus monkey rhadinovirus H26-95 TaxID=69256 RepID=Q9J2I2_9GAMA|nr:ORFRU10-L [Rhesus monkey rhadinovirus H26-95]QFN51686.1 ORF R U10 [Macacine gammaherpesvirus 5]QFN51778.1 ORF R U10 [Macacine gammaherpesvirus 5]QFN51870.1 ORF R U10 [Macacine gammaherpesvirus 5]